MTSNLLSSPLGPDEAATLLDCAAAIVRTSRVPVLGIELFVDGVTVHTTMAAMRRFPRATATEREGVMTLTLLLPDGALTATESVADAVARTSGGGS